MIKPGDKIHVEYVVESKDASGILTVSRFYYNRDNRTTAKCVQLINIVNPDIVKHIPKPPEPLKVGERVRSEPVAFTTPPGGYEGTILHLFEDRAWVKFDDLDVPLSPLVSNLKRIES